MICLALTYWPFSHARLCTESFPHIACTSLPNTRNPHFTDEQTEASRG